MTLPLKAAAALASSSIPRSTLRSYGDKYYAGVRMFYKSGAQVSLLESNRQFVSA